jgi:tRNA(Ile)-lysidine synthase
MMKTAKKKILAVSGGVDSVAMLHMFREDPEVVVAHFDHGIRPNAHSDALFVEGLATAYGLPYEVGYGELGDGASEAAAREARYNFLNRVARERHGVIYTAHHADDSIETVAINLLRGTGWRGLAPFTDDKIERPMMHYSKRNILRYAAEHGLRFRLDQSNSDDRYLRNRVRERLRDLPERKYWWVLRCVERQWMLRRRIESIVRQWLDDNTEVTGSVEVRRSRGFQADIHVTLEREVFRKAPLKIGAELVFVILQVIGRSATRPQTLRLIKAIRTLPSGKKYNLAKDYFVEIKRDKVKF